MELKSSTTTIFFLFLLFTVPYLSRGGSDRLDLEVYQIDYRGPETHSSTPPPAHHHVKPLTHRETAVAAPKSKGLKGGSLGRKVNKIQG
ncbi:uncharacterized protein LOC112030818 [Quercus suber]|uniref:Transmembrane protein n=1 Tax=Quercus suber TaxID=58331 RepID=A0AAW0LQI5_QUESU|nr:uncharacterized protein LOC112030818 [Quercus suber]POF01757.1 hypothetical protein CFP56_06144 [Quercus suber]